MHISIMEGRAWGCSHPLPGLGSRESASAGDTHTCAHTCTHKHTCTHTQSRQTHTPTPSRLQMVFVAPAAGVGMPGQERSLGCPTRGCCGWRPVWHLSPGKLEGGFWGRSFWSRSEAEENFSVVLIRIKRGMQQKAPGCPVSSGLG